MKAKRIVLLLGLLIVGGLSAYWLTKYYQASNLEYGHELPEVISYNEHIRPIINNNCIACHGGVKAASGVSFLFREEAIVKGESEQWAIKPGSPKESYLIERITDSEDPMPPADHGHMLSGREVALLHRWIKQGAEWETHWAYIPPEMPAIPELEQPSDDLAPIDHFVVSKLEEEGLSLSARQEKLRLMRRVSLDLTGLLPEPEDVEEFSEQPFEDYVDELLSRPTFGERWASMWMDLARYADSMGYEKDAPRTIWQYRDYLIRSFNEDKPYDQFIVEQLAGDLLPDGGMDALVATAFHRNTPTNAEGGTDDEEFRIAAVVDRNNTTWKVLQGVTMDCVQCHSHPYDPIRHEDYYKSFAYFNNTADNDDGNYPLVRVPADYDHFDEARELDRRIQETREARNAGPIQLDTETEWQAADYLSYEVEPDTGSLVLNETDHSLSTKGTVPWSASYSVEFKGPADLLGALKIEALPADNEIGRANPGFVLSHVELSLKDKEGELTPVELEHAFADYTRSDSEPEQVFNNKQSGWTVYPRLFHPHWLVVVPKEPLVIPDGSVLVLQIHHKRYHETNMATLKKWRLFVSSDSSWQALATSEEQEEAEAAYADAKSALKEIPGKRLPVTRERDEAIARETYLFVRGNWMTPGETVEPGKPDSMPGDLEGGSRLDFAQWMVSEDNPLTARVIVNRIWSELFGVGIVNTLGDFGTFGERPSHPELLDYLSVQLMDEHGWRLKPLLKEMVLSATYQQDSYAEPELLEKDPGNRLYARGPRTRLSAEMVRDQALQVCGLLSSKQMGPSVMPYQPEGIWNAVYSKAKWEVSEGEDRYRRALYTFWRRTSPYPSMLTFDVPSREVCSIERVNTNTPLQALVTLNDPVYFEAAKALGKRMATDGQKARESISDYYFRLTAEPIDDEALEELLNLFREARSDFEVDVENSAKIGANPEQSAYSIVANVLLNLDATLTK